MNHTIMPVTAQGEPIPLIKLGQGRGDEHESGPLETVQTFAEKLRSAGYQEPVLRTLVATKLKEGQIGGEVYGLKSETLTVIVPPPDTLPLVVSREGFRAGVLSKESVQEKISNSTAPMVELTQEEFNALTGRSLDTPVVSREGFRAGVLSAIAGGVIIASFYLAWGLVAACLFTAACVGFVAGMVITQEWK